MQKAREEFFLKNQGITTEDTAAFQEKLIAEDAKFEYPGMWDGKTIEWYRNSDAGKQIPGGSGGKFVMPDDGVAKARWNYVDKTKLLDVKGEFVPKGGVVEDYFPQYDPAPVDKFLKDSDLVKTRWPTSTSVEDAQQQMESIRRQRSDLFSAVHKLDLAYEFQDTAGEYLSADAYTDGDLKGVREFKGKFNERRIGALPGVPSGDSDLAAKLISEIEKGGGKSFHPMEARICLLNDVDLEDKALTKTEGDLKYYIAERERQEAEAKRKLEESAKREELLAQKAAQAAKEEKDRLALIEDTKARKAKQDEEALANAEKAGKDVTDLQLKNNVAAHDLGLANSEVNRLKKEKADILKDMEPLRQAITDGETLENKNAQLKGDLDKLGGIFEVAPEDRNEYYRISNTIEENKKKLKTYNIAAKTDALEALQTRLDVVEQELEKASKTRADAESKLSETGKQLKSAQSRWTKMARSLSRNRGKAGLVGGFVGGFIVVGAATFLITDNGSPSKSSQGTNGGTPPTETSP